MPAALPTPHAAEFWDALDRLVATCPIQIDRPRGSAHPRYSDFVYPLDYGYLQGTQAADGGGVDVWVGSQAEQRVTAIIITVDLHKRDAEQKILVACTLEEARLLWSVHNQGDQAAMLIVRPDVD